MHINEQAHVVWAEVFDHCGNKLPSETMPTHVIIKLDARTDVESVEAEAPATAEKQYARQSITSLGLCGPFRDLKGNLVYKLC
jgi:hypothetical protein